MAKTRISFVVVYFLKIYFTQFTSIYFDFFIDSLSF